MLAERSPRLWQVLNRTRVELFRPFSFPGTVAVGRRSTRAVAITFDDGPDPDTTPGVLDALEREGATATFFFLATAMEAHPELARRAAARHEIGTHLHTHRREAVHSVAAFDEEIRRAFDVHERVLGERPRALRFPFGKPGRVRAPDVARHGLTAYHWTFSSEDSSASSGDDVVQHVVPRLHPGAIVLFHDGRGPGSSKGRGSRRPTLDAMPVILAEIRTRGLRTLTASAIR